VEEPYFADGGSSHREGAKRRWEREKQNPDWAPRERCLSVKRRKRDVMQANRANTHTQEVRQKAVATRKRHRKEADNLEMSQKRSRRASTNYTAVFAQGGRFFLLFSFFIFSERLDVSPGPEFTPIATKKARIGKRKAGKTKEESTKLDLSVKQQNELKKWVKENSMPEDGRNLTAADIVQHLETLYDIKVYFFFSFWNLCFCRQRSSTCENFSTRCVSPTNVSLLANM
jgi:hypothetical protein